MLKITPVENGWLLENDDPLEGCKWVVENNLNPDDFIKVLHDVKEHFGYYGSKHDERRIFIEIRKGDGTELKD